MDGGNWQGGSWSRWSPAPAMRATMLLHAGAALAVAAQPALWPEALAALGGNHALLAACMHPRCALLGPNLTRVAGAAGTVVLTFDDGPDPAVTPRVLEVLEAHGATASFFMIGERAARHAALAREVARRGHGVENHSHRHPYGMAAWTPAAMLREIQAAQGAIAAATGRMPRFFRAPAGLRSPLLDPALAAAGLALVSWTRRGYDAVRSRPEGVLRRLTRGLAAGDILLLHDGRGRVALEVLPALLAEISARGLRAVSLDAALAAAAPASRAPAARASR